MVLILKGSPKKETMHLGRGVFPTILVRLAKLMVNMQYNRKIFASDGTFINSQDEFLIYRDDSNEVDYSITPGNGFIQWTSFPDGIEDCESARELLLNIFDAIAVQHSEILEGTKLVPFSYGSFHPTTHFTALFEKSETHWERSIIVDPTEASLERASNIEFLWAMYSPSRDMKQWVVVNSIRHETHIFRDMTTIVVDFGTVDLPEGIQFEPIYEKNIVGCDSIVRMNVHIDKRYGLHPTLASLCLTPMLEGIAEIHTYTRDDIKIPSYDFPDFEKLPQLEKIYMWRSYSRDITKFVNDLLGDGAVYPNFIPTPQHELIETYGACLESKRGDICVKCYVPLYAACYVLQSVRTKKCVGMCLQCYEGWFRDLATLESEHPFVLWKTVYPRNILRVLEDKDIKIAIQAIEGISNRFVEIMRIMATATHREYDSKYGRFIISGMNQRIILVPVDVFDVTHYKLAVDEKAIVINGCIC